MSLSCLRCREPYEKPRRSFSHYCPPCRVLQRRERDAERHREVRAATTAVRGQIETYVDRGMDRDYAERYHDRLDDVLDELRGGRALLDDEGVPDRMPAGANSPAGPEDGISTYFTDLADELDAKHRAVAAHPWFAANPHWAFDLHNESADLERLRIA